MFKVRFCSFVLLAVSFAAAGCGASLKPVTGTVTLDGTPVDGASVTFISEDGSTTASGITDSTGTFKLYSAGKEGTSPGKYKVTVIKTPAKYMNPNAVAGDESSMKQMKAMAEKSKGANPGGGGMPNSPAAMQAMMASGGKAATATVESELPQKYATPGASNTLTATVPSDSPIELKLESDGKKK